VSFHSPVANAINFGKLEGRNPDAGMGAETLFLGGAAGHEHPSFERGAAGH
jgi:hypothetical protein